MIRISFYKMKPVFDRDSGALLSLHKDVQPGPIFGVRVYDNRILATAGSEGSLMLHKIGMYLYSVCSMLLDIIYIIIN